jgi:uncharacterized lipoprotein YddW (UPF0748 family)
MTNSWGQYQVRNVAGRVSRQSSWFVGASVFLQLLLSCSLCWSETEKNTDVAPPLRREFRAAWVATVANIDWPSKPGLSTADQKAEMIALLDDAVRMNLNAIILQVRPSCDALYESKLEPWSEFLTGEMGKAPSPYYDPLEFAIDEAHKRGIELHVWFNPYRTRHTGTKTPASDNHVSKTHPEIVKQYGDYHWMDPGEPEAFEHTMAVIRDVVERYDIDGVHMDDYFYPYPVTKPKKNKDDKDEKTEVLPFPDDPSWEKAQAAGNKLERNDWRRDNINRLVKQIHDDVKKIKPWVKFGISPFGIGRPGKPPQIKGFDQYESLYADTEKWFKEGWVDYFTPQLYWKIGPPQQAYPALLWWWNEQNTAKRHLWPGNYSSRMLNADNQTWAPDELIAQIWATRAQQGATGNVHFSMKALTKNAGGIADALIEGPYREPALVPESPWMATPDQAKPETPEVKVKKSGGRWVVKRENKKDQQPWLWVVKTKHGDDWHLDVVPGADEEFVLDFLPKGQAPAVIAVSAVDRIGRESPTKQIGLKGRDERE